MIPTSSAVSIVEAVLDAGAPAGQSFGLVAARSHAGREVVRYAFADNDDPLLKL